MKKITKQGDHMKHETNTKKERVYIFLDKTLTNPQKAVQATHLGIESGRHFPCDVHPSVLVLAINLSQSSEIKATLTKRGIKFVEFYEPLFDKVTGIATEPISMDVGKYLQHYPMLKDKDFIAGQPNTVVWHPPLPPGYKSAPLSQEEEMLFQELIKNEEK